MTTDQERRAAPRFEIQVPTEYEHANTSAGTGHTENVSVSGVLVERSSAELPIDTELRMRFSFFHGSFATVFTAAVVRYTEDGFAARFVQLGTDQIEVLQRALSVPPPL
jgi:hypothetical protein